jgi:hypothetical protein
MADVLAFNRAHKNGWISYKQTGVAGAVFIDRRMLSPEAQANPPQSINVEIEGLLPAGANATEASAAKAAKKQEADAKKAERAKAAADKAAARLQKLQDAANKAAAKAAAVAAKAGGATPPVAEGAEVAQ